ncbi:uncharacterized protein [Amphiura filiformis]|uniref:uncharacterized protein n=1 Tax=Amphiura filiformis TaxID=82378 RepID=UPI003B213E1E
MASVLERTILVKGIPFITNVTDDLKDKLSIHFSKGKNGGGDIELIVCPLGGDSSEALVVFESDEVVHTVLGKQHVIENQEVEVERLPPVIADLKATFDGFCWSILSREKSKKLVAQVQKLLGDTKVQGSKYKINEISCTTDQMNEIGNYVLKGVGLLEARSVSNNTSDMSEVTERCVYIGNIPYVTDEKEQLEEAIKTHVESKIGSGIERVICGVQGSLEKALAVFKNVKDREKFLSHGDQQFFDEILKVEKLPPIFETAVAMIDNMYMKCIPRNTLKPLVSTMKADFGATFTSDGRKLIGTVQQIQEAVFRFHSALGLPEDGEMSDHQSQDKKEKPSINRKDSKTQVTSETSVPTNSNDQAGKDAKPFGRSNSSAKTDDNLNMSDIHASRSQKVDIQDAQTDEAMDIEMEPNDGTVAGSKGQQSITVVTDYFSHPHGASNYHASQTAPVTSVCPSTTDGNQQTRVSSSFIPVDKMIYQYMKLNLKERLERIQKDNNVKIKFDTHKLQEPDQIVVELKSKKETSDIAKAQEEFLALQTEVQKGTMIVPVSCKGVDARKHDAMQAKFKKKFPKIVMSWKNDTDCILLGETASVETAAQELNDTISCYESMAVDEITFEYLRTVRADHLETIKKKYNIDIELQDDASSDTNQRMAHIKPSKKAWKKSCKLEDLHEAKEAFINLYQQTFFSLKRVPVKCRGISKVALDRAIKDTKQKFPDVIIMKTSPTEEIIICAVEETVDDIVREFRSLAGLVSKRKLKKADSDSKEQLTQRSRQTSNYSLPDESPETVPSPRFEANITPSWFATTEGVEIHVITGDITTQRVDIIVNSANAYLRHNGGVAKAIFAAAGPGLQRECDDILKGTYIQVGECLDTNSFDLRCKRIVHAVGPEYAKGNFPRLLERTFLNALVRSDNQLCAKSVAIPLISSGGLGGPKEVCAEALITSLTRFSQKHREHLKQVFLVNKDEDVTRVLKQNCLKKFRQAPQLKERPIPATTATATRLSYKTRKGLDIEIESGDITKAQVDTIVNAANKDLRHGGGVAGAISRAAGKDMQDECRRIMKPRPPLSNGECIVTSGYKLPCRILHIAGPIYGRSSSDNEFYKKLKETFLCAIRHANIPVEAKTLAIPLISSGIYGGPKPICAKALLDAIEEFDNDPCHIIKTIHLINLDEPSTQALVDVFNKRINVDVHDLLNSELVVSPSVHQEFKTKHEIQLYVKEGDITPLDVDVIVNPTDSSLLNSFGISKAISRAAGNELQQACGSIMQHRKWSRLASGDVIETKGFGLKCKYILHTPSPYYGGNDYKKKYHETLSQLYQKCLFLASSKEGVQSIALPLIGAGLGGCPNEVCAHALATAMSLFRDKKEYLHLQTIVLVSIDPDAVRAIESALSIVEDETRRAESNLRSKPGLKSDTATASLKYDTAANPDGQMPGEQRRRDYNDTSARHTSKTGERQNPSSNQGTIPKYTSPITVSRQDTHTRQDVENTQQTGIYNTYLSPMITKFSSTVSSVWSNSESQSSPLSTQALASTVEGSTGNNPLKLDQARSQMETGQHTCGKCYVVTGLKHLESCCHTFCKRCIMEYVAPSSKCFTCGVLYCVVSGLRKSTMTYYVRTNLALSGETTNGAIVIDYNFPDGILMEKKREMQYKGNTFTAYLPNSGEGIEVVWMLRNAFITGKSFKIDYSQSSKLEVMWSGQITHKNSLRGGIADQGFPDPGYLTRVKEELRKCGIVSSLSNESFKSK